MQWWAIFKKELLELWRSKKLIWVPLVMMLLTVMDPLTYYYLPEILDMTGGLPEGAIFEVPTLKANEALMMGLDELSMFGIIVIAIIAAGTIAGERKSGVAEIIFVKPIHYGAYIFAKWLAIVLLSIIALFWGLLFNWYYTNLLFGEISFIILLKVVFFYGLWFTFVVTIALFFNAFLRSPGIVFTWTIATVVIMRIINTIFGHKLTLFPNQLSGHLAVSLETSSMPSELLGTAAIIFGLIIVLLISASYIFKQESL